MKVHLAPVDLGSLEFICLHLRDQDKREIYNIRDHDNPIQLAWETHYLLTERGIGAIAWWRGRPAAMIGLVRAWPMVWEAVAYGTDDWRSVAVDLMRWGRGRVRQILQSGEGHRLQAHSHTQNHDAHKFLQALGARQEGPPEPLYGKDGSPYLKFVWLKGEHDHLVIKETTHVLQLEDA